MTPWSMGTRTVCVLLMLAAGVLLAVRMSPRAARRAWTALLVLSVLHALGLSFAEGNLVNINVVHHYLGAKYAIPYARFYRVVNAAAGRPQVAMRDLEHPPAILRGDPRDQRAYYIDLLRHDGVGVDATVSLEQLRDAARSHGALEREAERTLQEALPPDAVEELKRDVRLALDAYRAEANAGPDGRDISGDYGFNGSPFYALVRKLDPTLHAEFGPATAIVNLLWQVLAALLLAWVVAAALGLRPEGAIATAALLFASWDFVGWALPGLVFAGFWLPVALALLAVRRGHAVLAGAAIAWATLIKLFPLVLLLPLVMRALWPRPARGGSLLTTPSVGGRRWCLTAIGSCTASLLVLGAASTLTGRSWGDFLDKILVQFQAGAYLQNSVSMSQGLLALGIHGSPLRWVLSGAMMAALVALCWPRDEPDLSQALPARMLVLLTATGWLVQTWFNYYAIAPLLLLPLVGQRRRWLASAVALATALSFALPEFDDPTLWEQRSLQALKLAPYVLAPAVLAGLELAAWLRSRRMRRTVLAVVAAAVAITGIEAWRFGEIRRLDGEAERALDAGQGALALNSLRQLVELSPGNAMAHMNEGIALMLCGQSQEAGRAFGQAARLAPESAPIRHNLGLWHLGQGSLESAAVELGAALALQPWDDRLLCDMARLRQRQGRSAEARQLLQRALEVEPSNRRARTAMAELGPP